MKSRPQRYSQPRVHRMPRVLPGQPIQSPKPRRSWRGLAFGILTVGLVIFVYWFVFMSQYFAVTTVELSGTESPAIKALAEGLKGENIWRLNTTTVEQRVQQVDSSVGTVSLVRGIPHTIRLTVTYREPALRWHVKDTVYIVDTSGRIFAEGDTPPYAALPKISDKSAVALKIGLAIVDTSFIQFVKDLYAKVPTTLGKSIAAAEITETSFHLDVVLEGDIRLRFTTLRPLQEQLDGVQKILQTHPEAKYVDVRVPRWGYWK